MRAFALVLIAVAACGAPSSPPPAAAPARAATACTPDPATAATRTPKPAEQGCVLAGQQAALDTACAGGDAASCYQLAVCVQLGQTGQLLTAAQLDAVRTPAATACAAGIAEACTFRAGITLDQLERAPARPDAATLRPTVCADLVRACHLGDETGGCQGCAHSGC